MLIQITVIKPQTNVHPTLKFTHKVRFDKCCTNTTKLSSQVGEVQLQQTCAMGTVHYCYSGISFQLWLHYGKYCRQLVSAASVLESAVMQCTAGRRVGVVCYTYPVLGIEKYMGIGCIVCGCNLHAMVGCRVADSDSYSLKVLFKFEIILQDFMYNVYTTARAYTTDIFKNNNSTCLLTNFTIQKCVFYIKIKY